MSLLVSLPASIPHLVARRASLGFSSEEKRHNTLPSWRFPKDVPPPVILPRGSRVSLWPFSWLRAPRAGLEGRQFQATHCSFMFTIHPSSYLTLGPDTCCLPSTPIAATLLEGSALPPCLSDLASQQERGGRVTRTLGPCYQPHTLPEHRAVPQRDAGFSSPSHEPLHLTRGLAIAL